MRFPWPPGREYFEGDLDLADLPPPAQRILKAYGLDALLTGFYHSEDLDIDHWWWVRPCAS
jgi:hypothetical protein